MVDAESVLLNVQERDKWRRRMELLERSLDQVRIQRLREELRLRRLRKDIARLQSALDDVLGSAARQGNPGRYGGTQRIPLTYR